MPITTDYSANTLSGVYQRTSEQLQSAKLNKAGADTAAHKAQGTGQGEDTVSVSSDARLLAQMQNIAEQSPDVRTEKVAELKQQVQNGTYKMDNKAIATAILRDDMGLFR